MAQVVRRRHLDEMIETPKCLQISAHTFAQPPYHRLCESKLVPLSALRQRCPCRKDCRHGRSNSGLSVKDQEKEESPFVRNSILSMLMTEKLRLAFSRSSLPPLDSKALL
jgi:hypothetical protein